MDSQQYIYLYDLPKKDVSSIKIAQAFKDKAGVTLTDTMKPQIKKDLTKPFYTAMVNIKDTEQFQKACESMRYFDIEGKPCRALPFDRQLLGSNKEKLTGQNVFVRAPKDMMHEDLHKTFEQFGKIKSLKASLNADYSSRGYGFICFENAESAERALAAPGLTGIDVIRFQTKDNKAQMRKLMNNIYVKNIPVDWSDDQTRALFEAYGNIKSLVLKKNEIGQFGFVCFDDPNATDKEYGPKCAAEAIEKLNNMNIGESEQAPRLVVRHALKGAERAAEKIRETIRYKTSKKRCNLYVKNFPNDYKKEDLMKLFSSFGEIESIRLDMGATGNAFAFVCFKEPTDAAKAKNHLHNYVAGDRHLGICYYEIKELRQLQNEEAKDKADWEKYQAQQTGGFQWNELTQLPNLTQILSTLMQVIHMHEAKNASTNQAERMATGYQNRHGGNRQGGNFHNNQGGERRPYQNNRNNYGGDNQGQHHGGNRNSYGQQNQTGGFQGVHQQRQQMGNNNMGGMGQQNQYGGNNMGMPQQPQPQMPQPPQANNNMGNMPQPMQQQQQNMGGMGQPTSRKQQYEQQTQRLIPACVENNPHLQEQVGQCIYDYIHQLAGPEQAPKITGMLIDLPVPQQKQFLLSYESLQTKVHEAQEHLRQTGQN